uniref:Uncharacterized protein n=1 Tax=Anopheles atroparvus TaxID=41427 RepID=A0A182ISJ1_ANOAO
MASERTSHHRTWCTDPRVHVARLLLLLLLLLLATFGFGFRDILAVPVMMTVVMVLVVFREVGLQELRHLLDVSCSTAPMLMRTSISGEASPNRDTQTIRARISSNGALQPDDKLRWRLVLLAVGATFCHMGTSTMFWCWQPRENRDANGEL